MTKITDKQIEQFIDENLKDLNLQPKADYNAMLLDVFRGFANTITRESGLQYIDNGKYRLPTDDISYYSTHIEAFSEAVDSSKPVPSFITIMANFEKYIESISPKVEEPVQKIEPKVEEPIVPAKKQSLWGRIVSSFDGAAAAVLVTFTSVEVASEEVTPEKVVNNEQMTAKKYLRDTDLIRPTNFLNNDELTQVTTGKKAIIDLLEMLPDTVTVPDIDTRIMAIAAIENKLSVLLRYSPAINHEGENLIPSAKGLIVDYSRKAGLAEIVETVVGPIKTLPFEQHTDPEIAATAARAISGREPS